ncbi:hypothetical protein [Paenibacillus sp. Soil766]|uniref:hypothetical protein n=1 Tax=Paenibacillus sp. Soil766 TaxID=1736404 RepID=UPI0019107E63|nr:hypothetical protein [Paenibacillus sp. Soil766]
MRSYEEQRQQKISQESSRQREAVKPLGYVGVPSSSSVAICLRSSAGNKRINLRV